MVFTRTRKYAIWPSDPRRVPRPLLSVRLRHGQRRTLRIFALVDSGADVSTFSTEIATGMLGIDLATCDRVSVHGVAGGVDGWACDLELEVEGHWFPTRIHFIPGVVAILGRHDVFIKFRFGFDQRRRELLLQRVRP